MFPIKQIYNLYFNKVLPAIEIKSRKDSAAYTYLPESVAAFPEGVDFENILANLSFKVHKTIPQFLVLHQFMLQRINKQHYRLE